MRWNGRLLPVDFTSGEVPSIPMNLPLLKNRSAVAIRSDVVRLFEGVTGKVPHQRIDLVVAASQLGSQTGSDDVDYFHRNWSWGFRSNGFAQFEAEGQPRNRRPCLCATERVSS
jgi:hypothetical protein